MSLEGIARTFSEGQELKAAKEKKRKDIAEQLNYLKPHFGHSINELESTINEELNTEEEITEDCIQHAQAIIGKLSVKPQIPASALDAYQPSLYKLHQLQINYLKRILAFNAFNKDHVFNGNLKQKIDFLVDFMADFKKAHVDIRTLLSTMFPQDPAPYHCAVDVCKKTLVYSAGYQKEGASEKQLDFPASVSYAATAAADKLSNRHH